MENRGERKDNTGKENAAEKEEMSQVKPAMDEGKQRSLSDKERLKSTPSASSGANQGWSGRTREDEDLESISSQADISERDLKPHGDSVTDEPLDYSETDADEDEGLGDGNLGKSARDVFEK